MRKICLMLMLGGTVSFTSSVSAQNLLVKGLRYWTQPAEARIVLDTNANPNASINILQNPPRLVINLKDAQLGNPLSQPSGGNQFFAKFYSAVNAGSDLSVVIELKQAVHFKSFTLPPNKGYGHRLVIDVYEDESGLKTADAIEQPLPTRVIFAKREVENKDAKVAKLNSAPLASKLPERRLLEVGKNAEAQSNHLTQLAVAPKKIEEPLKIVTTSSPSTHRRSVRNNMSASKQIVVAIDAGHGGKDPGSHGASGTEEKRVVYEISRKLQRMIDQHQGMKAVMVRDGDYFIKLRQRMAIARSAKADLFVSIHADAFTNASAKGASVFTLSNRGATSEAARWLADNENAADLVGGVSLDDKDDVLASVLLDLSQTATTEASGNIAKKVLSHFRSVNPLHKSGVQKAGFMVLKSPDIPSILVETGFISNPEEESKLRSDAHQTKVARAIFNGIVAYFKQYVPGVGPTQMADATQVETF